MMTSEERARIWAQFMSAALSGLFAAEDADGFHYGHRSEVARPAAAAADAALTEYEKRFAMVVRHA